jgi:hypothetical protein
MTDIDRRAVLKSIAAVPVAALTWTETEALAAARATARARRLEQAGAPFVRRFFTDDEWATVRVLVDLIIPRDDRSGSATDAGVPEFMDFMMDDQPNRQTAMRGGLAWLTTECLRRYDRSFTTATDAERRAVLDEISWPGPSARGLAYGATFFASFRDLTASGFWTSRIGIDDLGYMGNTSVPGWNGCPEPALRKLGLEPGRE